MISPRFHGSACKILAPNNEAALWRTVILNASNSYPQTLQAEFLQHLAPYTMFVVGHVHDWHLCPCHLLVANKQISSGDVRMLHIEWLQHLS